MKVTVKEGWSSQSKLAITAIVGGVLAIISAVALD